MGTGYFDQVAQVLPGLLEDYQKALYDRALAFRESRTREVDDYAELMGHLFDFNAIRAMFKSGMFSMRFDAMHAITGPYAKRIFEQQLGAPRGTVINGVPLEDFGGHHPGGDQPDLTGARRGRMALPVAPPVSTFDSRTSLDGR